MRKCLNTLLQAGVLSLALAFAVESAGADRVIRAHDFTVARGQTNTLFISLDSLGNENALGFTVCFDTNLLDLVLPVRRGTAISNLYPSATFTPNTAALETNGWLGVVIGLDIGSGETWPAGTNQLVEISFRARPGAGSSNTTVLLCDSITAREVSDDVPQSLPATYIDANVLVTGDCHYALNTNSTGVAFNGGSRSVNVLTDFICAWTAENTNAWIEFTSATNGTGAGSVTFNVALNPVLAPRSGTVTIAGQTFTVNQGAFVCDYAITPANRAHGPGAETNSISLTTSNQCPWTIENTNSWITILSPLSGTGSATVDYRVTANPNIIPRTGTVAIAGQTLTLVQDPLVCTYALTPVSRNHAFTAVTNSFSVTAPAPCAWTAGTTNAWIILISGPGDLGNGSVNYRLLANPASASRLGSISVNGETFAVTQGGAPCDPVFTPPTASFGFNTATGLVSVALPTGCAWNATTTNSWITINSGASGLGNGSVGYTVASNTQFTVRLGVITIAGANFTLSQASAPCPTTLNPVSATLSHSDSTGTVSVAVAGPCAWTTANTNAWVQILSGSGTSTGSVTYAVGPNTNITARVATLIIAGEIFTLTQNGAPCAYALTPTNQNLGPNAVTNSFAVTAQAGCAWAVDNTNSWITIQSGASGSGSGVVTYSLAANPLAVSRTGTILVAGQGFAITQDAAACTFSISPTTRTHGPNAVNNTVVLTTISGCAWTISNLNSWITFPAGTNGLDTTTITYEVSANPDPLSRTGLVMVAGRLLTIVQNPAPCSYVLDPTGLAHGSGSETGLLSVATHALCAWTSSTTDGWITINSGASSTGPGSIGYTLAANTNGALRTGHLTVQGQTFTITQAGLPCFFTLTPTNGAHGFNAVTSTVAVTTLEGCNWTVSNSNSWITILSGLNNSGSNTVSYALAANPSTLPRAGVVVIAGLEFPIAQNGAPCTYTLIPGSRLHPASADTNTLIIEAGSNCGWIASTTNAWLTLTSATNGSGTNTIGYSVAANPNPAQRIGALFVGGRTFVITQLALVCEITLTTTGRSHGAGADTNTISITANGAGCPWNATTAANWISLTGASGTGDGTVTYTLAANPNGTNRTATVQIADKPFTITQGAAPCLFTVLPLNITNGPAPFTNTINVTTLNGCTWTVLNTNSWITPSGSANHTNSGSVSLVLAANPTSLARTGVVEIAGQLVTVVQQGLPCVFALSTQLRNHARDAVTNSVNLAAPIGCAWSVSTAHGWITILSPLNNTGSNTVNYTLSENFDIISRTGTVQIADQTLTLIQAGTPCVYALTPTNRAHVASGATNTVTLTTATNCAWAVVNTNSWITFTSPTSGLGSATVEYIVAANLSVVERAGTLVIGGETFLVTQSGEACAFVASPLNRHHTSAAVTNSISVTTQTGCAWTVSNSPAGAGWISFVAPLTRTNSGSINYVLAAHGALESRTGVVAVAGQLVTLSQDGITCSYTLSPTNGAHGFATSTNSFSITAPAVCVWNASSTNDWISILSPTNGSGNGTVSYALLANPVIVARTGAVEVAGQIFPVVQAAAPCVYELAPTARAHPADGTNSTVALTVLAGCAWDVVNTNAWVAIDSPTNGAGSATIAYTVLPNLSVSPRSGVVVIGGQSFAVTQFGVFCEFELVPVSRPHGHGAATNSFAIHTPGEECPWSATTTNSWITLVAPASGTGSNTITYRLAANPVAFARSGTIQAGGQVFTITQDAAPCVYALTPTQQSFTASAATSSVSVATLAGCNWTATTTNFWLTILSASTNNGNGTASYAVSENLLLTERVGFISIADQTLVVTQAAVVCTYALSPTNRAHGSGSATGLVSVTTSVNCPWNAVATNSWITLTVPGGVGTGTVGYTMEANPTSLPRSGVVVIGGRSFTISQAGAGCTFSLGANSAAHGPGAVTNAVTVTTLDGCVWSATTGAAWVTILPPLNHTNSGSFSYALAENPTALLRTGVVTVADQTFTITQGGAACTFALATNSASHGSNLATNSAALTTLVGCVWNVVNTNSWFEILSGLSRTNSGVVQYRVLANPTALPRAGVFSVQGLDFTVTQAGAACSFSLAPGGASFGFAATNGNVAVTTLIGCAWSVSNGVAWITVQSPLNHTNSGTVNYSVAENTTALPRNAVLRIAGQDFTVAQAGAGCAYALSTNAAVHSVDAQTNSVSLTTLVGCAWSVSNTTPWIEILSPLNNTGSSNVTYRVLANPTALWRTGVVSIASLNFTVAQAPAVCTFALATNSATHGAGAVSSSVALTTLVGCTWSVSNGTPWITILSPLNNSNSAPVNYSVAANPTSLQRSGVVRIAGLNFNITQAGAVCSYDLDSFGVSVGGAAGTNTVQVLTLVGCPWSVSNIPPWIVVQSPLNNTNSGAVILSVLANPTALERSAVVRMAGLDFAVSQAAAGCTFSLATNNVTHPASPATNTVAVTTLLGCPWTVENTNAWLVIQSPLNNTNSGSVTYRVLSNTTALARSGVVRMAGINFTVNQLGAGCEFTLGTNFASFTYQANTGSVAVTTLPGCTWPVSTATPWLTILSSLNNSNSGTVSYRVGANPTALFRTGLVSVAGIDFTVVQGGAPCTFALATNSASHGAGLEVNSVAVTTLIGCTWSPSNGAPWITITSPLNNTNSGTFSYQVATNPTALPRTTFVNIQGQVLTITQAGAACNYVLSSGGANYGFGAGPGVVGVTTLTGCVWTATTSTPWISVVTMGNQTNSGLANFNLQANPTALTRTGTVLVAGQNFTVTQDGAPCVFNLNSNSVTLASTLASSSVSLNTLTGCVWTASTATPWLTILNGPSYTNSGVVSFSAQSNSTALFRTGTVTVAGQTFTVAQAGAACSFQLSSSSATHGPGVESNTVSVTTLIGCTWSVSNGAPWITILSSLNNSNSGSVSYLIATNPTALARSAVVRIDELNFTVNQDGAACNYFLSSTSAAHGAGVENGSVNVSTLPGCVWTVANSTPWITISSPLNNTNSGTVSYSVSTNISVLSRTGTVSVAGQIFTVAQLPGLECTLALLTSNNVHRAVAESGGIGVLTLTDCSWGVTNTNAWVTITSGPRVEGSGHVLYSLAANTDFAPRSGFVNVGGIAFGLTQMGTACTYRVSPTNRTHGTGANVNSFTVTTTAGCGWTVFNTNSWLTITANGSGTGSATVSYSIAANPGVNPRYGYFNVGGDLLLITQWGSGCGFTVNPPIRTHGPGAETSTANFTVNTGTCGWTVVNANPWITFNTATSGTGAGSVSYTVAANPGGTPRQGVFTIGGAPVTVNQAGVACSFAVTPPAGSHNSAGASGSIPVTTGSGCIWYIFNTNSWISFDGWNGTNSGSASYTVAANPTIVPRSGLVIIGGQSVVISQDGAPCTYALVPSQISLGASTTNGAFNVQALDGCDWTATATQPWIVITTGANGEGNGTVTYAVAANTSVLSRTGAVDVAGQFFTVVQAGVPCVFALSAGGAAHGGDAETGSVDVTTDASCNWSVVNTNSWITITNGGTGSRMVSYSVAANPNFSPRSGVVVIAGQNFTVTQAAKPCTYVFTPAGATFAAHPTNGSFSITASNVCGWTVVNSNAWITITSAITNGSGNGTVTFSVTTNSGALRMGGIYVGGTPFTVIQAGATRVVRALTMSVPRGQTNRVRIVLESTGHENAMGVSLQFDTNQLSFVQAVRGAASSNLNATFSVNATAGALAQGRVGFQIGLDIGTGVTFPPGSNIVAEVLFRGTPGSSFVTTGVGFTNTPIFAQVSDLTANSLPATYVPTTVNVLGTCNFTLSTNATSVVTAGGARSVTITAHPLCSWTVANTNSWITFTPPVTGTGNGAVNFTVAANPTGLIRTGLVSIAGVTYTVTQAAASCSYSILPITRAHSAGTEGGLISVTAVAGCPWTVSNTNAWVTILPPTSGTGNGDVAYSVAANASSISRTGVVTIAAQNFTIVQNGSSCVFAIAPVNQTHSFLSVTGTVAVTSPAGCPWTVSNTNAWLAILSSTNGFGNGMVTYAVGYNPDGQGRTGVVTIATLAYTVVQTGNTCPVTLPLTSRSHGEGVETNSFSVNAAACAWSVSTSNSWITLLTVSGSGNGPVNYYLAANPTLSPRTGSIFVAGREFTITQAPASCLYSLSSPNGSHDFGAVNGQVTLTTAGAACNWTVINTNPWVTITSPTNGTTGQAVDYSLAENPNGLVRTGLVQIAGLAYSIIQTGAPCTFALSVPNPTHGFPAATNTIGLTTLTGCRWTVSNTNAWISILTSTNQTNSGLVTYSVQSNATALTRVGLVVVGDQVLTITQTGVACTTSISPTNRAHGATAATNTVNVFSPVGCTWTVSNALPWVSILSFSGTGNGPVTYAVEANAASFGRTGVVTIANQTFTITQPGAACFYTFVPSNVVVAAAGDFLVANLNTLAGCPWTLVNTNTWIEIFSDTSGVGATDFAFLVYDNPTGASRTGRITSAGQTFTIRQSGLPCSFTLSATNAAHGAAAVSSSLIVDSLTGCPWTVSNLNNWITFPGGTNYAGSNTLNYSVGANPLAVGRAGQVMIAGQLFTVTQAGVTCQYALSISNITMSSLSLTGLVGVLASNNCTWQTINTNPWISIKSGIEGTNNGLVRFTPTANESPLTRSGNLVIAGIPFAITQFGTPCSYSLSPPGRLHSSLFSTGQVSVVTVAECAWSVNNTNDWISITGQAAGSFTYSLLQNPGFQDRIGTFTVADQTFTVTQLGAGCGFSLQTNGAFHGALMETGTVSVVSPDGCAFTVGRSNTWITILSSSTVSNLITVNYSVAVNVSGAPRISQISVGSAVERVFFNVTQATVFCTFTVGPTNFSHGFEAEIGAISVTTSNPCPWTVLETNTWITIPAGTNYTGNQTVNYHAAANPSSLARTGLVVVAGRLVRIVQAGLVCSYTIAPSGQAHGFLAATGSVFVTSPTLCTWNVNRTNSWITILGPTNVTGTSIVSYALTQNPSVTPRASVIRIAGLNFSVTQEGAPFLLASNKTLNCDVGWDFDPPVNAGNCLTPGETVGVFITTTNFGCGPTYIATRVWAATNACGNGVLATQIVSVVTPPPLIFCNPNKTIECTEVLTFDAPFALEYCGGTNVSLRIVSTVTTTNGQCGATFVATRTWEATDSCGLKSTCSQSVFVVDTTPPVALHSADKTVQCGDVWGFDRPSGTDSCNGTNVTVRLFSTVTNLTGTCGYFATRIWEIVDPCNNITTSTQVVTAIDTLPPVMNCAPNKIVECGQPWTFNAPTATDYCLGNITNILIIDTTTNRVGHCGNTFTATRTWQAADGCGNLSFCSQTVRIVDTTPPTPFCAGNKTVEFGPAWNFDAPTGLDDCGGTSVTVSIVSTTTNAGPCGPAFTATRVWELVDACTNKISCTQVVTVRDTTPPVFSVMPDLNVNCFGDWSFGQPAATDASGTNLTITEIGTFTNGVCGAGYTVTRSWQVLDQCGNSALRTQTAYGRAKVMISGTLFTPTNYPASMTDKRVPGATLVGPTNTSTASIADGTYGLVLDAASNVVVYPLAPPPTDPAEGVTTLDISLVRRHILNVANFDTPYKLLSGDVDASGTISTLDLSLMRRLVLGLTNRLPAGLWRFVPADYTFPNPSAPWGAPTNRVYPSVSADVGEQNFVALKLGDVNASGLFGAAGQAKSASIPKSGPAVTFRAGSATNTTGTSVVVGVTVNAFDQIGTAQGTVTWDPAVVRFTRVEGFGLAGLGAGNFGTNHIATGQLSFSWDDPQAVGVTAPDGTVMFAVRFDVVGEAGSVSPVAFSDAIAACEASVNLQPITFQKVAGVVKVLGASPQANLVKLAQGVFANGAFGMSVPTVSGRSYILEYTDSLSTANWTALPPLDGNGAVQTLTDPSPAAAQRFYRLRIE